MAGWVRVATLFAVAGCTSASSSSGSLAYIERDTQNLRLLDLATEQSSLIDPGRFSTVSIAPDGAHVSYAGEDNVVKLADRTGVVIQLPSGGCGPDGGHWITSSLMTYCMSDATRHGTMVLAGLATTPRFVESYGISVTADGALDAYVDAQGDVMLENIDGTNSRVLVPSTEPTAARITEGFTPDQQHLIVTDHLPTGTITRIVALDRTTVDLTGLDFPSSPFGVQEFIGASMFSPDGSELLMESDHALVAVALATGNQRTIAAYDTRVTSAGAVFLDATRVLWVRVEDHSVGDIGMLSASLHVAGPTGDVVIDSKPTNSMWSAIAVLPNGTIALPGDHLFLDAAGTARIPNALSIVNILGITADGASIISFSTDGTLRRVDLDGEPHDLAHGGQFIGPSAAYTAASSSSSVQPRALKN